MISDLNGFDSFSSPIGAHARKRQKRKKKKKKKKQSQILIDDLEEVTINIVNKEKLGDTGQHSEMVTMEPKSRLTKNNYLLRKLVRRARYFDFPEDRCCTCHVCGEEGHGEEKCTAQKQRRPCFVCGTFEHTWRRCKLGCMKTSEDTRGFSPQLCTTGVEGKIIVQETSQIL